MLTDMATLDSIVVVGSPTALGGHFAGMERTPAEMRAHGLLGLLATRLDAAAGTVVDHGDARNDPGWAPDLDPRMKNHGALLDYLPRLAGHVADGLAGGGDGARLLVLGGDCTSHAGALAGIRRARPGIRLGLAWFDAHGDFNTPDTTPSGNVWGMPFAMACGRGDPDLVAAVDGPTVDAANAGLFGGQVLDEAESRMLASSPVAQFGAGMLADDAGRAAVAGWSASGRRTASTAGTSRSTSTPSTRRGLGRGHARAGRSGPRHGDRDHSGHRLERRTDRRIRGDRGDGRERRRSREDGRCGG